MKKIIASGFMAVATIALFFTTSCKKNDITFDENDKVIAQESAAAQQKIADVAGIADEASSKEGFTHFKMAQSSCITKEYKPNPGYAKGAICTLTFNGDCLDNTPRSGQIVITYEDTTYNPNKGGSIPSSITFKGYTVNNTTIEGKITCSGYSGNANQFGYSLNIDATLTEGAQSSKFGGTLGILYSKNDKSYSFSGRAQGTTYSKTTYSISIDEPLIKYTDYKCIVKGIISFSEGNTSSGTKSSKTINFGDGTRDNKATMTSGSIVKEIEL